MVAMLVASMRNAIAACDFILGCTLFLFTILSGSQLHMLIVSNSIRQK
jgi:hypothetical protein